MRLASLQYVGGKSSFASQQTGHWIASLLPARVDVLYCEPFAGMLGVLLQRPKSKLELVNDLDSHIITWWRAVRDYPAEFLQLIDATPFSRQEFERCVALLDAPGETPMLQLALAVHVVISQSIMSGLARARWAAKYVVPGNLARMPERRIKALSERLRDVQLESKDGLEILERTASVKDAIIYADPPYHSADNSFYRHSSVDTDALSDLLQAQSGQVAISGFGDEWDHLSWHRHTRTRNWTNNGQVSPRIEVLWTNYQVAQPKLL